MSPAAPGVPVADHEIGSAVDVPAPAADGHISLLVRVHGVPVGLVSHLPPDASAEMRRQAVWDAVASEIGEHLRADGHDGEPSVQAVRSTAGSCAYAGTAGDRLVTVIVCTLGQDPRLRWTLESLLAQSYQPLEIVVVDNDPESGRVAELLGGDAEPTLRIVPEPRRGLSFARNAGLAAARGDLVAFTDDDAVADRDWVRRLVAPFGQDAAVACTSGLVLPAELERPSQLLFEQYGGFDKGFRTTVWQVGDRPHTVAQAVDGERDALFPFSPGIFGSGNNMAFDRAWILEHGGFDTLLGAGARTRSGEDVDAFLTVLLHDRLLVYVPQAIIRHFARSDLAGLRTQVYGYGIGMAATITKHLVSNPRTALTVLVRLPAGLAKLVNPRSSKNVAKEQDYPRDLTLVEMRGYLVGPTTYLAARLRRRLRPSAAP